MTHHAETASTKVTQGNVSLANVCKRYPSRTGVKEVLQNVTVDVASQEFVSIVGASGAGKTTLLRCIAGLQPVSSGEITMDDVSVTQPPERLGVVFQDYGRSLFPWMTVGANVALPLRSQGVPKATAHSAAEEALTAVGLADTARQYPWMLSGGMQQRVAIARALAYGPSVLLLDEPFASVDAQTRAELEDLVLDIRDKFGVTTILVTHDIDEAIYVADRVILLSGRPATIRASIEVELPSPRQHVRTKSDPLFSALRAEVTQLLGLSSG
ncbi:ABC transporter ATP-binding protein [Streptomyces mirabilis]|uniref:ABC transporter ATP-binding protein n=1 Tax=Streptomyces mirabilis TaxID=68239 RepID=UPI0036C149B6